MPRRPILNAAVGAFLARLKDETYGLNACIGRVCADYPDQSADMLTINFDDEDAVFLGDIEPDVVLDEEDICYPCVVIYSPTSADDGGTFNAVFSGKVGIVMRYIASWSSEKVNDNDFLTPLGIVEEAFFQCFRSPAGDPAIWYTPGVGNSRIANGSTVNVDRSAVTTGGKNFVCAQTFAMDITVDVR